MYIYFMVQQELVNQELLDNQQVIYLFIIKLVLLGGIITNKKK